MPLGRYPLERSVGRCCQFAESTRGCTQWGNAKQREVSLEKTFGYVASKSDRLGWLHQAITARYPTYPCIDSIRIVVNLVICGWLELRPVVFVAHASPMPCDVSIVGIVVSTIHTHQLLSSLRGCMQQSRLKA